MLGAGRPVLSSLLPRHHVRTMSTFESIVMKVASSPAVHFMEDSLAGIHDSVGLPWWGTIMLSTAAARTFIFLPAHITQQKVQVKRMILSKEMSTEIIPALEQASIKMVQLKKRTKEQAMMEMKQVAGQIHAQKVKDMNCHLAKLTTPMICQIPVWVCASMALRNLTLMRHSDLRMAASPVEERFIQLSTEGPLWCSNLCVADPTLLVPVFVGFFFAANVWISSNRLSHATQHLRSRGQTIFTALLYSISAAMVNNLAFQQLCISISLLKIKRNGLQVPLAAYQPSAVSLYWMTSGAMAVLLNLLLMEPRVRRLVRIPFMEQEPQQPYLQLKENLFKSLGIKEKQSKL